MLFVHRDSLVLLAPTMSVMNVGQFRGHSCFNLEGVGRERVCACEGGGRGGEKGDKGTGVVEGVGGVSQPQFFVCQNLNPTLHNWQDRDYSRKTEPNAL